MTGLEIRKCLLYDQLATLIYIDFYTEYSEYKRNIHSQLARRIFNVS